MVVTGPAMGDWPAPDPSEPVIMIRLVDAKALWSCVHSSIAEAQVTRPATHPRLNVLERARARVGDAICDAIAGLPPDWEEPYTGGASDE